MTLEENLARSNEFYFLREFTFSSTKFSISSGELELADNLIAIGDVAVVFQLKEREEASSVEAENKWFESKVVGKASKQVRDTHAYLEKYPEIRIRNHRNHEITVAKKNFKRVESLIVYQASDKLDEAKFFKKFHRSASIGVIHLMPLSAYSCVLKALLTPAEVIEYLVFRTAMIERWKEDLNSVTEKALVGQYLISSDAQTKPSKDFERFVDDIRHSADDWDVTGILHQFLDRIYTPDDGFNYYKILEEFLKLTRADLKEFKLRFKLGMERANTGNIIPMRVAYPHTGCGFIFVPVAKEMKGRREAGLTNFTLAGKYDLKLDRCIGISFLAEENGWFLVDWLLADTPWSFDPHIESLLKENNPFPPVRAGLTQRYRFESE